MATRKTKKGYTTTNLTFLHAFLLENDTVWVRTQLNWGKQEYNVWNYEVENSYKCTSLDEVKLNLTTWFTNEIENVKVDDSISSKEGLIKKINAEIKKINKLK